MNAYFGEYIKSCLWFTNPTYANLAILLPIISSISLMYYMDEFVRFICSLWYLLLFPIYSNYLLFPCDSCDVFVGVWRSLMFNKINLSLWPCFLAKILLALSMIFVCISCAFLSIHFVCTCFFVDEYLPRNVYTWLWLNL